MHENFFLLTICTRRTFRFTSFYNKWTCKNLVNGRFILPLFKLFLKNCIAFLLNKYAVLMIWDLFGFYFIETFRNSSNFGEIFFDFSSCNLCFLFIFLFRRNFHFIFFTLILGILYMYMVVTSWLYVSK